MSAENGFSTEGHYYADMKKTPDPLRAPRRLLCLLAVFISLSIAHGQELKSPPSFAGPRVLPAGKLLADSRLGPLRGESGDFSFAPAKSADQWRERAQHVRRSMLVSLGLWPMPTKTPLNAVIHGKLELDDYTVEKVYLESLPGFYVTGSLYRPKNAIGRRLAVLSPHGHFPGGRFQDAGRDAVRRQIVEGAERFEEGGRSFMQSRCVQLARMGCVVFLYDMIGYADSVQISVEVAHRFSRDRAKLAAPPDRGFYSAAAELQLHNMMGLHTYNSIRALDFLCSLPDVDPARIAVTGGSGGGTQTFMLCAVDDRPLVSVPVVIVSTTRQGGCTCENISALHIGTYNLEFTALHAPKPLLLVSADDATRTMPQRGFPELRQHYKTLGAAENVAHAALLHFPHNYNIVSRTAMYHFANKHLQLGQEEPILERDYRLLTGEQLTVWNDEHPRPPEDPQFEQRLLDGLTADSQRRMAALIPHDQTSLRRYREVVGGALDVLIGQPSTETVSFTLVKELQTDDYSQTAGLLKYNAPGDHQAELPTVVLTAKKSVGRTVIWIHPQGRAGLYDSDGSLKPPVRSLLDAGATVIGVDLLYQGELLADGKPVMRNRWVDGEPSHAGWTYCYNHSLFAQRVHDVLAVIAFAKNRQSNRAKVDIIGCDGAGPWVAAACGFARDHVAHAAIDTRGFRFTHITDVFHADFLPGGAKYHDLPGILALAAPVKLWVAGETSESLPVVRAAYIAAGANEKLLVVPTKAEKSSEAAVNWLLSHENKP
jgi:hypothetical protein